ncbi:hypothetical protein RI129_000021, partial [Pyrocoelia pectoralis]
FPRTLPQAHSLWESHKLDIVINLNVPFDVIIDRAKVDGYIYRADGKDDVTGEPLIQREDDQPEVVRKRLEVYQEITRPVIEFYQTTDILQHFEGRTSDEIWPKVVNCLNAYLSDKRIFVENV